VSGRQRQTLVEAARERVTERTAQVVLITILGTRIHTDLWACAMVVFGSSVVFGSCGNFPARHQRRGDKSMGALSTLWSRQSSPGVASTGCVLCTRLYQPCHLASYAHEVAQLVPVARAPLAARRVRDREPAGSTSMQTKEDGQRCRQSKTNSQGLTIGSCPGRYADHTCMLRELNQQGVTTAAFMGPTVKTYKKVIRGGVQPRWRYIPYTLQRPCTIARGS